MVEMLKLFLTFFFFFKIILRLENTFFVSGFSISSYFFAEQLLALLVHVYWNY